jgi:hypothetical protein
MAVPELWLGAGPPRQVVRAAELHFGVLHLCLRRGEIGAALVGDRLVRPALDAEKRGALLDDGAFLEQPSLDETGDAAAHVDLLDGVNAADEGLAERHWRWLHRDDTDRHRGRRLLRRLFAAVMQAGTERAISRVTES